MSWAFGDPEAVTDFAYRAVHELAEKAKLLIKAYYGRPQSYAYFNGCSNGGRQGLKSVQIFPADFDGVIIGGAASGFTHAATEQLVVSINLQNSDIQGTSGAAILTLAQNATTAVCHGAVDSVIDDPRRCHWNPFQLVCKPGQDPSTCITTAQASALKANEATLLDPVSGRYVFSGMSPGSEFDQIRFGYEDGLAPFGLATYQLGLNDPTWDSSTFNLHTDLPVLDQALDNINAIEPDLTAFKELGGKLIEWHGWDDAAFTPGWTVKYYGQVVEKTGRGELRDVQDFYRLFMMPGVGHCGTGVGPDDIGGEDQTAVSHDPEYDIVSALEAWVEDGVAPLELIATGFNVVDVPSSGIISNVRSVLIQAKVNIKASEIPSSQRVGFALKQCLHVSCGHERPVRPTPRVQGFGRLFLLARRWRCAGPDDIAPDDIGAEIEQRFPSTRNMTRSAHRWTGWSTASRRNSLSRPSSTTTIRLRVSKCSVPKRREAQ